MPIKNQKIQKRISSIKLCIHDNEQILAEVDDPIIFKIMEKVIDQVLEAQKEQIIFLKSIDSNFIDKEQAKEDVYNRLKNVSGGEPDQGAEEFNDWLSKHLDEVFK